MKIKVFRFIYSLFFYCCLPIIFLRLWVKSRKAPDYKKRWAERLAFFDIPQQFTTQLSVKSSQEKPLWFHAVSVGETLAAIPLIKRFQAAHPEIPIVVTTMTPTGSERVRHLLGDSVFHVYSPYDIPAAISRFIRRINPRALVLMETELWPNMLYGAKQHRIPILLANARLSERSYRRYSRVKFFAKPMISCLSFIAAQTQMDANHFMKLGLPDKSIQVTGSIKFDFQVENKDKEQALALRQCWGSSRPVWIAASTHEGEERQTLSAFKKIRENMPNSLLIWVPRHPERFNFVARLCEKQNYSLIRRSHNKLNETAGVPDSNTAVYLGDTMGDLSMLFGAADVAFVGGSLVPSGGHNMLEPAAHSIPIITGPAVFNFKSIYQKLHQAGAASMVNNSSELAIAVLHWLNNPKLSQKAGQKGLKVLEANRGAIDKQLILLKKLSVTLGAS